MKTKTLLTIVSFAVLSSIYLILYKTFADIYIITYEDYMMYCEPIEFGCIMITAFFGLIWCAILVGLRLIPFQTTLD